MACEPTYHIQSRVGARHITYKWHRVRTIAHNPRPDAIDTCAGVLPTSEVPLHVIIKVALGGRGDELVVGDIVVPGREVPDKGSSSAADDDAVVGRALDQVVHESRVEAEGVGGGETGSGGWVWGCGNAAGDAANRDDAGA